LWFGELVGGDVISLLFVHRECSIVIFAVSPTVNSWFAVSVADFPEDPEDGETVYRRIRVFGKQVEKVRDHASKGQELEVTAYGPKVWTVPVRREGKLLRQERFGYYAGFVKVPKEAPSNKPTQQ
jgi:hypothetical protein